MENVLDAKILLVDDEVDILNLLETVLRKEGFSNILRAENGQTALSICKEKTPDLIILDIMLPDMDGHEICKRMREFTMVPIVFLSAKSEEIDRLLSFALGGDDYITKPFSPKEVAYRVKAILKRELYRVQNVSKTIKVDDLEICEEEGWVRKKSVEVQLTAMEFKLLLYLVSNRNVILSKARIIEQVWGSEYDGYDNTLMVHVRHLREKIEDDAANPVHILTVKKMGYKFVE